MFPLLAGLGGSFGMLALVIWVGRASAPDQQGERGEITQAEAPYEQLQNDFQIRPTWAERVSEIERSREYDRGRLAEQYKNSVPGLLRRSKARAIEAMGDDYARLLKLEADLRGEPSIYASMEVARARIEVLSVQVETLRQISKRFVREWRRACAEETRDAVESGGASPDSPAAASAVSGGALGAGAARVSGGATGARQVSGVASKKQGPMDRLAVSGPELSPLPNARNTALVLCYRPLTNDDAARFGGLVSAASRTERFPKYARSLQPMLVGESDYDLDPGDEAQAEFVAATRNAASGRGRVRDLLAPFAVRMLEAGVQDIDVMLHTVEALSRIGACDLAAGYMRRLTELLTKIVDPAEEVGVQEVCSRIPARDLLDSAASQVAWIKKACQYRAAELDRGEPLPKDWIVATRRMFLDDAYHAAIRAGDTEALMRCARGWAMLDNTDPIAPLVLGMCLESGNATDEAVKKAVAQHRVRFESLFADSSADAALRARVEELRLIEIATAHGCKEQPYASWLDESGKEFFFPPRKWVADEIAKVEADIKSSENARKRDSQWLQDNPEHPQKQRFEERLLQRAEHLLKLDARRQNLRFVRARQNSAQVGLRPTVGEALAAAVASNDAVAARKRVGAVERKEPAKKAPVRSGMRYGKRLRLDRAMRARESKAKQSVGSALRWLKRYQDEDGHWDSDGFGKHDLPGHDPSDGRGSAVHNVGITGLAILAFVGDGHDLKSKVYGERLERASEWLIEQQQDNGLYGNNESHDYIYDHAIATLALAELCVASPTDAYRRSIASAVAYLEAHRNPYSVWRYQPQDNDNDISVTVWCVSALVSASHAGVRVDQTGLDNAKSFVEQVSDKSGKHGYTKRGQGSARKPGDHGHQFPIQKGEALTAVGLYLRFTLSQTPEKHPIMKAAAELVRKRPPVWDEKGGSIDFYYWYYGSCALSQTGGAVWKEWKQKLLSALLDSQHGSDRGLNLSGSWDPVGVWGEEGGRIYSTAMGALALEAIYHR